METNQQTEQTEQIDDMPLSAAAQTAIGAATDAANRLGAALDNAINEATGNNDLGAVQSMTAARQDVDAIVMALDASGEMLKLQAGAIGILVGLINGLQDMAQQQGIQVSESLTLITKQDDGTDESVEIPIAQVLERVEMLSGVAGSGVAVRVQ